MSGAQGPVGPPRTPRFPGFDVVSQSRHWDTQTAGVVLARLERPAEIRFFSPAEEAVARALCDRLLGQDDDHPGLPAVPLANMIDTRLAERQTDGWRYEDMPEDGQAWRHTLAALDEDASDRFGLGFARCSRDQQESVIQAVRDRGSEQWHGLDARHVWSLWTRYACAAFYAHPQAWNEIGFPGPAYPRGYKNPGIDAREPFEVRDARPEDDPARGVR